MSPRTEAVEPEPPAVEPEPPAVVIQSDAPSVTVRVPQQDGEIRITPSLGDPVTYPVVDHLVTVPSGQAARFIAVVDGSELVGGSPSDGEKEKT